MHYSPNKFRQFKLHIQIVSMSKKYLQCTLPTPSSIVDPTGANAGLEDSSAVNNRFYYGSSSALSFARQMYSAILRKDIIISSSSNVAEGTTSSENSSAACYVAPENFSLLPRRLADQLMSLYWNRVHVLYPFLHRESFSQAY